MVEWILTRLFRQKFENFVNRGRLGDHCHITILNSAVFGRHRDNSSTGRAAGNAGQHIVDLVKLEVADLGCILEEAFDGQTGVEMALENEYAFVILDIMLPKLEGVEVLKQIREEKKRLPVVILTARIDDVSKVMLLELGAAKGQFLSRCVDR